MLQFSSMHFKQWVSRLRLLVGACVLPVVVDVSVLRRLQEKGHLYIMKCSTPVNVIGSNSKQGSVERKHFQGLIPLTRLDESSYHSAVIQRTALSHTFTIYCTVEKKGLNWHFVLTGLSFYVRVILSRSKTYFPGKDPVSYPLILFLSLFDGLAASPVLQWHTDLMFRREEGRKTAEIDE